mmetsp:Transcript_6814/g.8454  ORF Transcript_6814/g.8454 Transcript_6814/m.8454 type:complete len:433 (-) Transcript_6814:237-1535(-)|eukprot:CAMPEP_0172507304 /NCGR_PEP_ID=MMETSP1066-20121228/202763_1 /TAXON_ID=671091 /ORGANISM="Coscinodiscus wailesii, Strain CCMP2513" /LENGTH=432 /DNA_ID=CAMNT_0013284809 /DNA_START=35 /DNA_END=1333 /DNA_ORIENTATION=-
MKFYIASQFLLSAHALYVASSFTGEEVGDDTVSQLRGFLRSDPSMKDLSFQAIVEKEPSHKEDFLGLFEEEIETQFIDNRCGNDLKHPILLTNMPIYHASAGYDYFWMADTTKTINDWHVVKDATYVDGYFRNYIKVTKLSPSEGVAELASKFKASGKKEILFFIHGYNNRMYSNLCDVKLNKNFADGSYFVVPVVWHTDRGRTARLDYRYDRVVTAPEAGQKLEILYDSFFKHIKAPKSWSCHSMGCFVTQFFASDVVGAGESFPAKDFDGNKFRNLFMIAPDVRYDIFNYWGKDDEDADGKNDCEDDEWNTPDDERRIPDCRPGGGDALVKMVTNKVLVFFNYNDIALRARERRLQADPLHHWPISVKALGRYGNETVGRPPIDENMKEKVKFVNVHKEDKKIGAGHSYQWKDIVKDYYGQEGVVNNKKV